MKRVLGVGLALVTCTAAACNNNSTTTPSLAAPSINEVFSGTVQPGGSDFQHFTVNQSGEVDITLNTAGPPPTIQMNIGLGAYTTGAATCSNTFGTLSQPVAASTNVIAVVDLNAGMYCVNVIDVGNAVQPISYTITVAHP
jgi:hypothetical protein